MLQYVCQATATYLTLAVSVAMECALKYDECTSSQTDRQGPRLHHSVVLVIERVSLQPGFVMRKNLATIILLQARLIQPSQRNVGFIGRCSNQHEHWRRRKDVPAG